MLSMIIDDQLIMCYIAFLTWEKIMGFLAYLIWVVFVIWVWDAFSSINDQPEYAFESYKENTAPYRWTDNDYRIIFTSLKIVFSLMMLPIAIMVIIKSI